MTGQSAKERGIEGQDCVLKSKYLYVAQVSRKATDCFEADAQHVKGCDQAMLSREISSRL